jgi:ABC-2 type transport system ATP-binding protein
LGDLPGVERVEQVQTPGDGAPAELRVRLYITGEAPPLVAPAATLLGRVGRTLTDVKLGTPTLEDVFIHLTGRALR